MACRGMLYAIDPAQEAAILKLEGQQDDLVEFLETLWNEDWQTETDKSWDGMHRALSNGELDYDYSQPLQGVVLGGRPLHSEDWFIVVYKNPDDVGQTAAALTKLSDEDMRRRYFSIDQNKYDGEIGEEDWEYTLGWLKSVRSFYDKAATAKRAVVFAVDQ